MIPMLITSAAMLATVLHEPGGAVRTVRDPLSEQLAQADEYFDQGRYSAARKIVEDLRGANPSHAEILWRLSYYTINDGDAAGDDAMKEKLYRQSIDYAEAAVRSDARNTYARASLAAAYGSIGMFAGGKEKVRLANRIRDELDEALRIDSRNQMANTIYGTWHREVATVGWIERQLANVFLGGMPDGSLDKSAAHLRAAIAVGPGVLRHHYELGLTHIAAGRDKDAAAAFRTALKCRDGWKIDHLRRKHMREWLADQ
jgi:tetratricopeptide (TPR) repeat protein